MGAQFEHIMIFERSFFLLCMKKNKGASPCLLGKIVENPFTCSFHLEKNDVFISSVLVSQSNSDCNGFVGRNCVLKVVGRFRTFGKEYVLIFGAKINNLQEKIYFLGP